LFSLQEFSNICLALPIASAVETILLVPPVHILTPICANKIAHLTGYLILGGKQASVTILIPLTVATYGFVEFVILTAVSMKPRDYATTGTNFDAIEIISFIRNSKHKS